MIPSPNRPSSRTVPRIDVRYHDQLGSRNNPLMTALAGPRFVTLITTLPLTAHCRYPRR